MRHLRPVAASLLVLFAAAMPPLRAGEEDEPPAPAVEHVPPPAPEATPVITAAEWLHSVAWLADDARAGRLSGTDGCRAAETWIVDRLKALRIAAAPGTKDYRQPFALPGSKPRPADCSLVVEGPGGASLEAAAGEGFHILGATESVSLEAPAVFAGYGITAEEYDYDDYAGLDVKGKVVLVLRHEPQEREDDSRWNGRRMTRYAAFVAKARTAQSAGAAALIVVNDTLNHEGDPMSGIGIGTVNATIPVLFATRGVADAMLAGGPSIGELQKAIDGNVAPASRPLPGITVRLTLGVDRVETANIAAAIPGTDAALRDQWVVVGAHYDHVGDGSGGGLNATERGQIHNGADDNGSGTAALLELAGSLAAKGTRRSVLLLWFSGEELGLLGSAWYRDHPLVPHGSVAAMINLDMVGHYRPGAFETVGATSGSGLKELVDAAAAAQELEVRHTNKGMVSSDGFHFHAAGIPTLFLFSGLHKRYHRPTDDWWTVDAEGAARITRMADRILRTLGDADGRPTFTAIPRSEMFPARPPLLGVTFADVQTGDGALIAMVMPNFPAGKAGILAGDRIVQFAGTEVTAPEELRAAMGEVVPGSVVRVVAVRGGERLDFTVTFPREPAPR